MRFNGLIRDSLFKRYRPGFPDSISDTGAEIEDEKQEFISEDERRSTPLGIRKTKIVTDYINRNIQFLNLDENPYVLKFEEFKITPGTVRTLKDGPGWYRLIVAIDGSDEQTCIGYKRGFEKRINAYKSKDSVGKISIGEDKEETITIHEGLFFHDNVNGPENKTTVELIFAEFEEYLASRGEVWSDALLNKALVILEQKLYGKKLCRVKGHKDSEADFIQDIEDAVSNTPPFTPKSTTNEALRHPNGPLAQIGEEFGAAIDTAINALPKGLHSKANYGAANVGGVIVKVAKDIHESTPDILSPATAALLDIGRQLQGPFRD